MTAALAAAGIQAAGSLGAGWLANRGAGRQSKMEKTKSKLVDQLLASLNGDGPYKDLFNGNEQAFQKSFVEPAKNIFQNQIAPQIQQSYIASGQQRGTGLEDQLTRAGVDLDQLLNQNLYQFGQDAQNRKGNAIGQILGGSNGTTPGFSNGQALAQSGAGYLSSDAFSNSIKDIFKGNSPAQAGATPRQPAAFEQPRQGFQSDWRKWDNSGVGAPGWGGR